MNANRGTLELGAGLSVTTSGGTMWYAHYSAELSDSESTQGFFGSRFGWQQARPDDVWGCGVPCRFARLRL